MNRPPIMHRTPMAIPAVLIMQASLYGYFLAGQIHQALTVASFVVFCLSVTYLASWEDDNEFAFRLSIEWLRSYGWFVEKAFIVVAIASGIAAVVVYRGTPELIPEQVGYWMAPSLLNATIMSYQNSRTHGAAASA